MPLLALYFAVRAGFTWLSPRDDITVPAWIVLMLLALYWWRDYWDFEYRRASFNRLVVPTMVAGPVTLGLVEFILLPANFMSHVDHVMTAYLILLLLYMKPRKGDDLWKRL